MDSQSRPRDKEEQFIMMEELIHQKVIIVIYVYETNHGPSKHMNQKLTEPKRNK